MHFGETFVWLWIASIILIPFFFWYFQVLDLMAQPDSFFPGRNDKLIWALVLLFANVIGAVLYWHWKRQIASDAVGDRKLQEMKLSALHGLGRSGALPDAPTA